LAAALSALARLEAVNPSANRSEGWAALPRAFVRSAFFYAQLLKNHSFPARLEPAGDCGTTFA
jgi:hypothetical protein